MVHTPLGPAIVVPADRYLGAWLVCAARAALAEGARWEAVAVGNVAFLTWGRATQVIGGRSQAL
eukprot:3230738-Lingulodinium_polyedra.AAC.1